MPPALALLLLIVPVRLDLVAPPDAPPDDALIWRAWSPALGLEARPSSPRERVGATAPRRLDIGLPAEAPDIAVAVTGEAGGDAWFALALPGAAEAALVAVPAPAARWEDGRAVLGW